MQLIHRKGTHRVRDNYSVTVPEGTLAPESGISFRGYFYPARMIDGELIIEFPDKVPQIMSDGSIHEVSLSDAELDQLAGHGLVPRKFTRPLVLIEDEVKKVAGTSDIRTVLAQEEAVRKEAAAKKAKPGDVGSSH